MTSQFKTGQLNACSDLDELAAMRIEREQLWARVALLSQITPICGKLREMKSN